MSSLVEQLALRKASLSKTTRQPVLPLKPEQFDPLIGDFGEWRTCDDALGEEPNTYPADIRCLSFNIMKERDDLEARMAALLDLIERTDADVVCLQENTTHHNELLSSSPFVRSRYYRSTFSGQEHGFKVSLFSKLRSNNFVLYDLKGRPCITGYFRFCRAGGVEPALVAISSVHLTSGINPGIRREQLRLIYEYTAPCETSLVIGDFNTCVPAEDDASVEQDGFVDVWPSLYSKGDPGYTRLSHRLDRAALKSRRWTPHSMEIVGQGCVPAISDHFGIFLVLHSCQQLEKAGQADDSRQADESTDPPP
eukprot:TRINITY_DN70493_c0_g1_i1.p1 TRINITY_DN70493_c0_g1~~TRINITY_DN70493_c0_g1_i1.p1  ORF type:complete len:309 (+),score=35.58 TRINITY_DN70493_c0_g1_i1:63-989(+)